MGIYLGKLDPSISGSGGHDAAFRAAVVLVQDFALAPAAALPLMQMGFNARCTPPWTEADLRHKLESAAAVIDLARLGRLAGESKPAVTYPDALHQWAGLRGFSIEALRALGCTSAGQEVHTPERDDKGATTATNRRRGDNKPFDNGDKALVKKGGKRGLFMPLLPLPAEGPVLVPEGLPDTLRVLTAGHKAVIGLPNAKPGRVVLRNLQRLLAGRDVIIAPDPGQSGRDSLEQVGRFLANAGCRVRFIPAGDQDLDDRLKREIDQAAALAGLIDESLPWTDPKPAATASASDDADLFRLTDLGNAERFKRQHGDRLLFDPSTGWRAWDGRRWAADTSGEVHRLAHATARSLFTEAANAKDSEVTEKIGRHALKTQSRDRLAAMVDVARHLMTVDHRQFDTDPMLLNVRNGQVDLKTGTLRPHRREDYITRLVPVEYQPGVTHPTLEKVLREAIPDEDERHFFQKAIGYCLTGRTDEEVLFFAYGAEATSKSTLLEAIKLHVGDYAVAADPETFIKANNASPGGARGDVARFDGARLILTSEVDDGRRLAEGLVKRLTGGDSVVARRMYKDEFEFTMTGKLWLMANHRPRVDEADGAMWRRIRVVPFENQIPKDRRDPRVKTEMRTECGPALLAWAVQGCLMWQAEGLRPPAKIESATTNYRNAMDTFGEFIADCCIMGPDHSVLSGHLRAAYLDWAKENGIKFTLSTRGLAEKLEARGCDARRGSGGARFWLGIGLLDPPSDASDASDAISQTFPYKGLPEKVMKSDVTHVTRVTLDQAQALLDRLASRRVVVKMDGPRLSILGRPTPEENAELDRLDAAVRVLLIQAEESDLFEVNA